MDRRRQERVFRSLLGRIADGHWPPGQGIPPTRRIAEEFLVSRMTALAAMKRAEQAGLLEIRARRGAVALPGAAERARQVLAEMSAARRRLAVLVPDFYMPVENVPTYRDLIAAVSRQAVTRGIPTETVSWPLMDQVSFVRTFANRGFAAGLVIGTRPAYMVSLHMLQRQGTPLLLVNRRIPELGLPSLRFDDYGASWQMVGRFAAVGHRNMCLVCPAEGNERVNPQRSRINGWFDALRHAGLLERCTCPVCLVTLRELDFHMDRLLNVPDRPTALLFASATLLSEIVNAGIYPRIGAFDEISMATFDATEHMALPPPFSSVATLELDLNRTAECAVEMIEKMIDGEAALPNLRIPRYIRRTDSIRPAPEA